MTISDFHHLTTEVIRQAFIDRLNNFARRSSVVRSPPSSDKELPSSPEDMRVRRSISESAPRLASSPSPPMVPPTKVPAMAKSSVFSNFSRRKKIPDLEDEFDSITPPLPPPKDKGKGKAVFVDIPTGLS